MELYEAACAVLVTAIHPGRSAGEATGSKAYIKRESVNGYCEEIKIVRGRALVIR